ncbi:MAG: secretin N-terminal domain-containing protein [Planctomycetota bacterium]|jgi:type II secretory pathway component GspD/PulD (secretin)
MFKSKYLYKVNIFISIIILFLPGNVSSKSKQVDPEDSHIASVGRNNPFGQLQIAKAQEKPKEQPKPVVIVQPEKIIPQLYLETVPVEHLDAQSLKDLVEQMLTEHGSISFDSKSNRLIVWETEENIKVIMEQIERADKPVPGYLMPPEPEVLVKPELFVETATLKFLEVQNLQSVIGQMTSEYGSISSDTKTNSLIICDTKENLKKIFNEIKKADKTPQQIMVEVVILDVRLDDDTEIGINWDLLSDKIYDVAYRQNLTSSRMTSTIENSLTTGNATAFNTQGLGGDFSLVSGTVRNVVHLLQEEKNAEVIASPRVMMVSGKPATISAVEEIPYNELTQTTGGGGGELAISSTSFKDVGVKLNVTATITDENLIYLTVQTEQKVSKGESITEVPIVDSRTATTSLLLKDGQIVILGGLRRQAKGQEVDKIPLLGDIPIVGQLFKNTRNVDRNSELVVFLAPHIDKGEPLPEDAMSKFDEITNRPLLSIPEFKDPKKELLSSLSVTE